MGEGEGLVFGLDLLRPAITADINSTGESFFALNSFSASVAVR